jgi:flagellar basal body-associated protein FliL
MDERALKRLLLILVASIIVIMLAKFMLSQTFTNLNKAAVEKKQNAARQQMPPQAELVPASEIPEPVSAVPAADAPASAVGDVAQ